jgi:hypothetical protein
MRHRIYHGIFIPMGKEVVSIDRVAECLGLTLDAYLTSGTVYWCEITVNEVTDPEHGWAVDLLAHTNDCAHQALQAHVTGREMGQCVSVAF